MFKVVYFLFELSLPNLITVCYFVINFLRTLVDITLLLVHARLFFHFVHYLLLLPALEPYLGIVQVHLHVLLLLAVCFRDADLFELVLGIA